MTDEERYTHIWEQVKTLIDEDNLIIPEAASAKGWAVIPILPASDLSLAFLASAIVEVLHLTTCYAISPTQHTLVELSTLGTDVKVYRTDYERGSEPYVMTTRDMQFIAITDRFDYMLIAGPREFILAAVRSTLLTARLEFVAFFTDLDFPTFGTKLYRKYGKLNGVLPAIEDPAFVAQLLAGLHDVVVQDKAQLNTDACQARGWVIHGMYPPDEWYYYKEAEHIANAFNALGYEVGYAIDLDQPQVYYRFAATLDEVVVIVHQLDNRNAILTSANHDCLIRFYGGDSRVAGPAAFVAAVCAIYPPQYEP